MLSVRGLRSSTRVLQLRIDGKWVRTEFDPSYYTNLVVGGGTSSILALGKNRELHRFNKTTSTWERVAPLPEFVSWDSGSPSANLSLSEVGDVIYVGYSSGIAMYTGGVWQDLPLQDLQYYHVAAGPNGAIYGWTGRDLFKLEGMKAKAIPPRPGNCGYNTVLNPVYQFGTTHFYSFPFGALQECEDRLYRLEGESWQEIKQPPFKPLNVGKRFFGQTHPEKVALIQEISGGIPEVFSLVNNEWERSTNRHFYTEQNAMPAGSVFGGSIDELVLVSSGTVYKLRNGSWRTSASLTKPKEPFYFDQSWMHPVRPNDVFISGKSPWPNYAGRYLHYLTRTDQAAWTTTAFNFTGPHFPDPYIGIDYLQLSGRSDNDVYALEAVDRGLYRGRRTLGSLWHWGGAKWEVVADDMIGTCRSVSTMSVTHSGLLGFHATGPRDGLPTSVSQWVPLLCFGKIENNKIVVTSTSDNNLGLWGILDKADPVPLFVNAGKVYTESGWQPVSSPVVGQIVGGSSVNRFVVQKLVLNVNYKHPKTTITSPQLPLG